MSKIDTTKRVLVTAKIMPASWGIYALCFMQVCAVPDATDEEILKVCNDENEPGTTHGWVRVVREDEERENLRPVKCADCEGRTHFLVEC